ncbi:MAG: acyl-ACP--UDP-N-acetylglucosamine O-acyltransferase [Alphaproteobacteria bacterium]|nr:acyl-ACP--UDP-N-acetylglucosamine O-acyltransferase [Alphaproteobacteria bacterium]
MTRIHPTAVIAPGAVIGAGAEIGPFCTIGPDVRIGEGVRLVSHVVVDGHTEIGEGAQLFPFCTVGLAPQDLKYKGEPTRTQVGARTLIREHVTIHRGTATGVGVTTVGNDCMVMAVVHVAHDCQIGNGVIIANNVVMGGHVTIDDNAVIGGSAAIHQFVHIGRAAMIGGVSGVGGDVVPFGFVIGNHGRLSGLNVIGLRRRGYSHSQIHVIRAAFKELFWGDGVQANRVVEVKARFGDEPLVAEILTFMATPSRRGMIRASRTASEDGEA